MLRYRQIGLGSYRRMVIETADRYRNREIDLSKPLWPGTSPADRRKAEGTARTV